MYKLDSDEQEILDSIERDEWRSTDNLESEIQRYQDYARATFKKDCLINIRLSMKDLETLQIIALEEGIPYKTLITSILHKYASGRLIDREHMGKTN